MVRYDNCSTVSKKAVEFVTKVQDGTFKKKHLCNHGRDFTQGPEQIAYDRFCKFEGSCSRKLLQKRTHSSRRTYIG